MTFPIIPASTVNGAYQISRSLRFRSSASAYLSRTPSLGNRKTWTWSGWVKRGLIATQQLFNCDNGLSDTTFGFIGFNSNDTLRVGAYNTIWRETTQVFRDPSAWYHIVVAFDTTQATGADRVKVYVNGVQVTAFNTNNTPTLNTDYAINQAAVHNIARVYGGYGYFDGYLAEVNFIDGQALTPSSFGAFDTNGVWQPARYTGSYGTNGFYLPYSDPSGSGNGNDTYTKLLLHGNGLNDSAWNGSSNHALTAFGSATTSTTQTKFGMSRSLYTAGASSQYYRTDASSDFLYGATSGSTNDFTVDWWFYPDATGSWPYDSVQIGDGAALSGFYFAGATFYASSNGSTWDIANNKSTGSPVPGQWNHRAFVRSGSTWYIFLNGTLQDTWTNSSAAYNMTTTNYLQIGRVSSGALYSTGWFQEIRWSAGIARWTSNFTPPTAPYSGGAGSDSSGNVNAWRPFNINTATSGTTYDSMIDSPTNYADGGNGRGNYPVMNPAELGNDGTLTLSNGNLDWTTSSSVNYKNMAATITLPTTGKWYWELTCASAAANNDAIGIAPATKSWAGLYASTFNSNVVGGSSNEYALIGGGNKLTNGSATAYASAWGTNTVGFAYDAGAQTLTLYVANVSQGVAFSSIPSVEYKIVAYCGGGTFTRSINFGQRPFTYTPPSGFLALNTQNLPTPTIAAGNKYFDATTYTGTGSNPRSVTGVGFQPDLVWIKARNTTFRNRLQNSVIGSNKLLISDLPDAEYTNEANGYLTSFNADGFTVTAGASSDDGVNNTNDSYIAWQWKAGGATPVAGTGTGGITNVQYSANVSSGFSIVTYTGSGANGTVTHGLGVAPSMIIVKRRDASASWDVYHSAIGATGRLYLNTTDSTNTSSAPWNNTAPTSSVFSLGTATDTNNNGSTIVAYCFAPVAGYSSFGSYTGNGSADGAFVYLGFRPRFIMFKRTNSTSQWLIKDTSRSPYNVMNESLYPNLSQAEDNGDQIDILSNGFKCRLSTGSSTNLSGATYIYAAFAEAPFKFSRSR